MSQHEERLDRATEMMRQAASEAVAGFAQAVEDLAAQMAHMVPHYNALVARQRMRRGWTGAKRLWGERKVAARLRRYRR